MTAVLGCIADDFTGGTDLAETLSRNGMRTIQLLGVPDTALASEAAAQADALVVALKIRTGPVEEAVSQALAALEALRAAGCRQFFWKYCSTFDSTPKGNIGPVAAALLHALGGAPPDGWGPLMQPIRRVAVQLMKDGRLVITRKGRPVDPDDFRGVYRLRLPE